MLTGWAEVQALVRLKMYTYGEDINKEYKE